MDPRGNVVGRPARVQTRSRSWDLQWGVDPSHLSQTLTRPVGANSGPSLTLNPSRGLNLMPWEAVRARGGAFWIPRVRIPAHPPESDSLCPATHLTRGSGSGSAPGRTPVGPSCPCEWGRGHAVFFSPSQGRRPPQNLGPPCRTVRAPFGRTRWVSGEWPQEFSRSKNGVGRVGKQQEEKGKKELSCEKEPNSQIFTKPGWFALRRCVNLQDIAYLLTTFTFGPDLHITCRTTYFMFLLQALQNLNFVNMCIF